MKNWDVTVAQLVLMIIGGYYMYSALTIFLTPSPFDFSGSGPKSFVLTMTIGIILLDLALALQEIRRRRARASHEVIKPKIEGSFFCRYCGGENKSDAVYCERCARKL